jgi:MOSC domain-containing protein YiiM
MTIGPRVVGIQAGRAADYVFGERLIRSAIGKTPLRGSVMIGELGVEGDEQVHRSVHGGTERALCIYPMEHLDGWAAAWERELPPGSFGENLTTLGVTEETVHIGDRFRFGSVLFEVSQPREPCTNLAGRLDQERLPRWIQANRRTGWYARVIEPGAAAAGMPLVLEQPDPRRLSVAAAYAIRLDKPGSRDEIRRLLAVPGLSSGWRLSLSKRL